MRGLLILVSLAMSCAGALAQDAARREVQAARGCADGTDFEGESYRIGDVRITTPLDFLHLRYLTQFTKERLKDLPVKKNALFRTVDLEETARELEGAELATPPFGLPVSGSVVLVYAGNCRVENDQKFTDLEFWYMPARVPSFFSHSFESYSVEMEDPAKPAGVAPRRFSVTPQLGYSASTALFGGASLLSESHAGWLQAVRVEGVSSARLHRAEASLSGGTQPAKSWMERSDWRVLYRYRAEPVGAEQVRAAQVAAVWKGMTRPKGSAGWVLRYGTGLDGGYRQADQAPGSPPGSGVVANTPMGGLKLFAGTTVRTGSHSFASSYGLLLGRTGSGGAVDFRKHLVDTAYSWRLVRNHNTLEVDSRMTGGFIETLCTKTPSCGVPLAERFFGGNTEFNFLEDNTWVIRSQPLLRSIPQNGLNEGLAGPDTGGKWFWAMNLTVGYPLFRIPLVPGDFLANREVMRRIDATPKAAEALLASAYAGMDKDFINDPGLEKGREVLAPLRKDVEALRPAWDKLENTVPPERAELFQICTEDHFDTLPLDIDDVEARKISIYLLGNRTGNLAETIRCLRQFSTGPGDELNQGAARLEAHRQRIQQIVESTDTFKRAAVKAAADLALAERTIHTLFHEVNLFSVSPVFIFDAGQIGPEAPGLPARRYSIGGGLRVSLASTVRFTAGYAASVNRQPPEGRGALFASLDLVDIFR